MIGESPAYEIRFTEDAKAEMQALDGSIRKQLRKVLEKKLAVNPGQDGKPLRGTLLGFWRHRFASHRIIYGIYEKSKLVLICAVGLRREGHKRDVYAEFESMVRAGRTAEQVLQALGVTKPKR